MQFRNKLMTICILLNFSILKGKTFCLQYTRFFSKVAFFSIYFKSYHSLGIFAEILLYLDQAKAGFASTVDIS